MSIFTDIAEQWQITDDEFAALESAAVEANDDHGFDSASEQRKRNDQAYFLFIFTRFEDAVNQAVKTIISNRHHRKPLGRTGEYGKLGLN